MVKRIIWSPRATHDRKEILEYWIKANRNNKYSLRLRKEFNLLIRYLIEFPNLGKKVNNYDARCLIKGDYRIFYDVFGNYKSLEIRILHIWDTRRNPDQIKL